MYIYAYLDEEGVVGAVEVTVAVEGLSGVFAIFIVEEVTEALVLNLTALAGVFLWKVGIFDGVDLTLTSMYNNNGMIMMYYLWEVNHKENETKY